MTVSRYADALARYGSYAAYKQSLDNVFQTLQRKEEERRRKNHAEFMREEEKMRQEKNRGSIK